MEELKENTSPENNNHTDHSNSLMEEIEFLEETDTGQEFLSASQMADVKTKYSTENVYQQDGPNIRSIKDIDLAMTGAEAENNFRKQKIREWVWQNIINPMSLYPTSQPTEKRADAAGTKAIMEEVYRKSKEAGIPEDEAAQAAEDILKEIVRGKLMDSSGIRPKLNRRR